MSRESSKESIRLISMKFQTNLTLRDTQKAVLYSFDIFAISSLYN